MENTESTSLDRQISERNTLSTNEIITYEAYVLALDIVNSYHNQILLKHTEITKIASEEHTLSISINSLGFSERIMTVLNNLQIMTINDLMQYSSVDLNQYRNFGIGSIREIKNKLRNYGLLFK